MEKQKEMCTEPVEGKKKPFASLTALGKHPYALLILLLFLCMAVYTASHPSGNASTLEKRLCAALSQLEGAGEVEVVIYQSPKASSGSAASVFSFSNGTDLQPSGVLVLAQGADDMRVRLEIASAVQSLLGVPASSVEVLKKAP